MDAHHIDLDPGLYLVATPIGNARDITLRALDVLASADLLAAEDTRVLRKLLAIHGIPLNDRRVHAYHEHNAGTARPKLLRELGSGKSVAYASDAGMPLIADPGFDLVREAIDSGIPVTSVPGASASLAALSVAGLPTDRFHFAGFVPTASGQRRAFLKALAEIPATAIFFETPQRALRTLNDAAAEFGEERRFVLCRELTKRFEDIRRGQLGAAEQILADMPLKGECVILIDRVERTVTARDIEAALAVALQSRSVRDAADMVSAELGASRRAVYQQALKMDKKR